MSKNTISKFKRKRPPSDRFYHFSNDKILRCRICKHTYSIGRHIYEQDTIRINNQLYIIPACHTKCMELFELNPLSYE